MPRTRPDPLRLAAWACALALLAACNTDPPTTNPPPTGSFTFVVDASVVPAVTSVAGPDGDRPVVALREADGTRYDFVANEVVIVPAHQAQLDAFLARHGASVVVAYEEAGAERTVVVRIDASSADLGRLPADAALAGLAGEHRFSSEAAARLMALLLREQAGGLKVASNGLAYGHQHTVLLTAPEGPALADAFGHPAFNTSGARPRVVEAWQYTAGRTASAAPRRVRVAIIDSGFYLDAFGSSIPDTNGASDLPASPSQHDFARDRAIIQGPASMTCGDSACPWHGHGSASVATGVLGNGAYTAGTGGQVADPILLNIDGSAANVKAAVDLARGRGAEVINMSFGGSCGWWCRRDRDLMGYYLAFERAHAAGIVMIAAAGNDGVDAGEAAQHPCVIANVICVGATGTDRMGQPSLYDPTAIDYSNFGAAVHLWAPTNIPAWYGEGAVPTTGGFSGTSAAAPYVAGVVAMMRSVNPSLTPAQVRAILLDTAWTDSPDSKVGRRVDALGAVRAAADHRLPADRFEPNDNASQARTLTMGLHHDLTIDRGNDADFFKFPVAGPTLASIAVVYPEGLGTPSLPPFGRELAQACGVTEQVSYLRGTNALTAVYRIATGTFQFAVTSPGHPLPYHLAVSQTPAVVAADRFEANDSLATATQRGDGGYLSATLHSGSDVDFYRVYSQGSFSTSIYSMTSRVSVESADLPLTLQLYNAGGALIGTASSSSDCSQMASLPMPQGFHTVRVSGAGVGSYRLWLGSYGQQHPLIDVGKWLYLILHPNEPVELILREPDAWFLLNVLSDAPLRSLVLDGVGLDLTLFDETGQQLVGVGEAHADLGGATLTLPAGATAGSYLLRVGRTVESVAGAELPLIEGRLTAFD